MKNIFEIYVKEICTNCRNRKECQEELRKRIDSSIKCDSYKRENKT